MIQQIFLNLFYYRSDNNPKISVFALLPYSVHKIWQVRPSSFRPCSVRGLSRLTRIPSDTHRVATPQSCLFRKFSRAPVRLNKTTRRVCIGMANANTYTKARNFNRPIISTRPARVDFVGSRSNQRGFYTRLAQICIPTGHEFACGRFCFWWKKSNDLGSFLKKASVTRPT